MSRTAYKESIERSPQRQADDLQKMLGQRLVAYATNVKSPKLVGRWAAGENEPREESRKRLQALMRTVLVLEKDGGFGPDTIRAFVASDNPDLEDRTPLDVIREGHGADAVRAAEAFLR
jgi:hypothetical protein